MKHLGIKGRQWLKAFHLFFAVGWVGAGICLMLMNFAMGAENGGMLHGIDISMKLVDDWVIIPSAIGSLVTGIIYSLFTNWGFFRHNWITVKWIITVGGILFGTFFLGPWLNSQPPISGAMGLDALTDPVYAHNKLMNMILGPIQLSSMIFALFISVFKPWKKKVEASASAERENGVVPLKGRIARKP